MGFLIDAVATWFGLPAFFGASGGSDMPYTQDYLAEYIIRMVGAALVLTSAVVDGVDSQA